jgi:hypothetical protein
MSHCPHCGVNFLMIAVLSLALDEFCLIFPTFNCAEVGFWHLADINSDAETKIRA